MPFVCGPGTQSWADSCQLLVLDFVWCWPPGLEPRTALAQSDGLCVPLGFSVREEPSHNLRASTELLILMMRLV